MHLLNAAPISFDIGSRELHGLEFGNPDGEKVLALHGWLDNAASFIPLAKHLKDKHLIAIDFTGHGHSEHLPEGVNYHYIDYTDDVLGVINALGWSSCSIIAHSMGAGIAPFVALVCENIINNLILLDGIGPITEEPSLSAQRIKKAFFERNKPPRESRIYTNKSDAYAAREKASRINSYGISLLCDRQLKPVDDGWTWRYDARLKRTSPFYLSEEQVLMCLKNIKCPCLFLEATKGYLQTDKEKILTRVGHINRINHQMVEGHHHVHMDNPLQCANFIQAFLSQNN